VNSVNEFSTSKQNMLNKTLNLVLKLRNNWVIATARVINNMIILGYLPFCGQFKHIFVRALKN
jgi:hypothetical protein